MERIKFKPDYDFLLQNTSNAWVDTCVDWVPGDDSGSDDDWYHRVMQLERLESFNNILVRRGRLVITPEIYREMGGAINYFRRRIGNNVAKEGVRQYSFARNRMLENRHKFVGTQNKILASRVENRCKHRGLHPGEIGLIGEMISFEGENLFVSGDGKALAVCREILLEKNTPGYVYDIRFGKVFGLVN